MVDFGSCGSAEDHSDALQIVREGAIHCSTVYGIVRADMSFLYYHGSIRRYKGMWENTEMGVVIRRKIRTCYSCFTYAPVFTVSLV